MMINQTVSQLDLRMLTFERTTKVLVEPAPVQL